MVKIALNSSSLEVEKNKRDGKARRFKSKFIEAGLINYQDIGLGQTLLKKVTIDKFLQSIIGAPVVIEHHVVDKDNVKDLCVGYVTNVWFDATDGWYYCEGIINDDDAEFLIEDAGWSVSCSFDILAKDTSGGILNDIKYDTEILDGNFLHLAIVENPRFREANMVFNSSSLREKYLSIFNNGGQKVADNNRGENMTNKTLAERIKAVANNESMSKEEKDKEIEKLLDEAKDDEKVDNKCAKNKKAKNEESDKDDKKEEKKDADNESDPDDEMDDEEGADNESDKDDKEDDKKSEKADNKSDFDRVKKTVHKDTADNASGESLHLSTGERLALGRELY